MAADALAAAVAEGAYDLLLTKGVAQADPTAALEAHRCQDAAQAALCDADYDALVEEQAVQRDPDARAELVREAFTRLYAKATTLVLWNEYELEAYDSEKWQSFTRAPADTGAVLAQPGYWGVYGATPVSPDDGAGPTVSVGGVTLPLLAAIVLGVIVLVSGVALASAAWRLLRGKLPRRVHEALRPDPDIDLTVPHEGDFEG
jgi:peptide/nickel transport system substrate-binding protein